MFIFVSKKVGDLEKRLGTKVVKDIELLQRQCINMKTQVENLESKQIQVEIREESNNDRLEEVEEKIILYRT